MPVSIKVHETSPKELKKLIRQWKKLPDVVNDALKVGLPTKNKMHVKEPTVTKGHKKTSNKTDSSGVRLVDVALYNEFGTQTSPKRSFLRSTLKDKKGEYLKIMKAIAVTIVKDPKLYRREMGKLGVVVEDDIKEKIVKLSTPANAASTVAQKGFQNPLVWSSQMVNSIRWILKKRGKNKT